MKQTAEMTFLQTGLRMNVQLLPSCGRMQETSKTEESSSLLLFAKINCQLKWNIKTVIYIFLKLELKKFYSFTKLMKIYTDQNTFIKFLIALFFIFTSNFIEIIDM